MDKKIWWGAITLASLVTATLGWNLVGNEHSSASLDPSSAAATAAVKTQAAPAPADAQTPVAEIDELATPARDLRAPAASLSQRAGSQAASALAQRQRAALQLRKADVAAAGPVGVGPAEACFNQMKTVFCPIIAQMPFVRDVAGQVALWGRFDCPVGVTPKI